MKLSIIIPAYNEATSVEKIINKIFMIKIPYSKEIIVVNDGSTDSTENILKRVQLSKKIFIINNDMNLGKGESINIALKKATGDIILIQDADLEYDPCDIPKLLKPFDDEKIKVVYGSRILKKNPISHWTFNIGGRILTLLTNLLYNASITDEATGYKLFRSQVIKNLKIKSSGFEFCPEVTAKILKTGIKITEVPINYNPRPISEKKIKWLDGFVAVYYLFKYRFFN